MSSRLVIPALGVILFGSIALASSPEGGSHEFYRPERNEKAEVVPNQVEFVSTQKGVKTEADSRAKTTPIDALNCTKSTASLCMK